MGRNTLLAGFLGVIALMQSGVSAGADLRMGDYRAPTPISLDGARVVDDDEAAGLVHAGQVLPIDVLPAKRNAETGAWLVSKPRMNIPGSIWLPNVGYGDVSPALEHWFMAMLEDVTAKDRDAAIMFYCIVDCWMSWNAAQRAIAWGYRNVIWYPDGTDLGAARPAANPRHLARFPGAAMTGGMPTDDGSPRRNGRYAR